MTTLKYYSNKTAIINPEDSVTKIDNFPKVGVTCFSSELLESVLQNYKKEIISKIDTANGSYPIYKINYKGIDIAVFVSRVGAPACVGGFEEVIAMGLEKLIMFGTCGVLDSSIGDLAIIIPSFAIRDEGTSYHYHEASDEISVNEKYTDKFINLLEEHNYSYTQGKTWTTDAFYRETANLMALRKQQGAVCVEMECSAMSAVAKFRNIDFFEFFYAADNLDSAKWDARSLECSTKLDDKEKIVVLAFELATRIASSNR